MVASTLHYNVVTGHLACGQVFLSFPRYGICEIEFSHPHSLQDKLFRNKKAVSEFFTPASNIGYLAPPGQFFMGAKLFIGTPWMGNEGFLKKKLVWAM